MCNYPTGVQRKHSHAAPLKNSLNKKCLRPKDVFQVDPLNNPTYMSLYVYVKILLFTVILPKKISVTNYQF